MTEASPRAEPLRRSIELGCSVERAFSTFTDRIDLWWPRSHRRVAAATLAFEPHVGGRLFERTELGDELALGEVVRWEPPTCVSYTWRPGSITEPTLVEVWFAPIGERTRVEIVHREGAAALGEQWPARVERFSRAWAEVLPALAEWISTESA